MDSINRQNRKSDIQRWQTMDFVVGYEIHISNNPSKECEICKRLAGKYPKQFLWDGWHDGCKCYITAILKDEETCREQTVSNLRSALYGTEYKKFTPKNAVNFVLKIFIDWFLENRKSWYESNNTPDFITKNMKLIISSYEYYKN